MIDLTHWKNQMRRLYSVSQVSLKHQTHEPTCSQIIQIVRTLRPPMQTPMHPRSHEWWRIRSPNTHRARLAQLLSDKRIFISHEVLDSRRSSSTSHASILHAILDRVRNAIERAQSLPGSTSGIAGGCLFEDVGIEDWN